MKANKFFFMSLVICCCLTAALAIGCSSDDSSNDAATAETAATNNEIANPASTYCEQQGYTVEMRTNESGTYGVCKFPDGNECDEWQFYRGECGASYVKSQSLGGNTQLANPSATYCQEKGYEYEIRETSEGQTGVCKFPDGTECDGWAYYRGECGPK